MRRFLYLEGEKLKIIVNKPVYVGFLLTDVTRLGLLHTKTSKKGSLPFFSSHGELYIPVLPIDIIFKMKQHDR